MFLERNLGGHDQQGLWQELGHGAPTIMALAKLCGSGLQRPEQPAEIGPAAKAILFLSRDRGTFEIKGSNEAVEAVDRFLTVFVELDDQRELPLRVAGSPEQTMTFFEGFRQLCAAGYIVHHLYREFSLTSAGFAAARLISDDDVAEKLSSLGASSE